MDELILDLVKSRILKIILRSFKNIFVKNQVKQNFIL